MADEGTISPSSTSEELSMAAPDEPLRWTPPTLDDLAAASNRSPARRGRRTAPAPPTLEEIQAIQTAAHEEGLERGHAEATRPASPGRGEAAG
jgi:hypothetical protein